MATYLIDFENVHHHGLSGIDKLSTDDFVVIFVGSKDKSIPLDAAIAISKTSAQVIWKKSEKTAPNYLDIQLASYLGSLVGENKGNEFHIISKDQGFIAAVDFWSPRKPNMEFILQPTISGKPVVSEGDNAVTSVKQKDSTANNSANNEKFPANNPSVETKTETEKLPERTRKKIREAIKSMKLRPSDYTVIYTGFVASSTEAKLQSHLAQSLGPKQGTEILNLVKGIFKNHKEENLQSSTKS